MCAWLNLWVLLGLDWVLPMMFLIFAHHMVMHLSRICSFFFFSILNLCCVFFSFLLFSSLLSLSLSLSLSLLDRTSLWHPNRENPLRLRTLFKVPSHPLRLFFLFRLTSLRTSRPVAFILNAKLFYRISLTLRYPMSFKFGDGNLYGKNLCAVPSCLYRSSTLLGHMWFNVRNICQYRIG